MALAHVRASSAFADGIVITPSHNPPQDGGFKYNPPNGGPADADVTSLIQNRANAIIDANSSDVKKQGFNTAWQSDLVIEQDLIKPYVDDLDSVLDMKTIADAGCG